MTGDIPISTYYWERDTLLNIAFTKRALSEQS